MGFTTMRRLLEAFDSFFFNAFFFCMTVRYNRESLTIIYRLDGECRVPRTILMALRFRKLSCQTFSPSLAAICRLILFQLKEKCNRAEFHMLIRTRFVIYS